MPRIRTNKKIFEALDELEDMLWYLSFRDRRKHQSEGREESDCPRLIDAQWKKAEQLEAKYGRDRLWWDEFESGMLHGKWTALVWALGAECDAILN